MKTKRHVIGLTGGIATGKSTALQWFQRHGISTFSADVAARECVQPGTPAHRAILRHFGAAFRLPDNALDRKKLGQRVFENAKARRVLERIVHPCVINRLKAFIDQRSGFLVLDIPLLYEAKLEKLVDEVVVVYATQTQQLARLKTRNGYSRRDALQRIHAQWPLRKKCARADAVLRNTGSLKHLEQQLKTYLQKM